YDDSRGAASKLDVIERPARLEQAEMYRAPGQRFKRDRADELGRGARHHDVDLRARLRQQASKPRCLIAGDSSRHPKEDMAPGVRPDWRAPVFPYSARRRGTT